MSTTCAVCKHTRKRCPADCLFAPYFPGDNMERFHIVRKCFGVKQLSYILNSVLPNQREDAVNWAVLAAERRHTDPVYGLPGVIIQLQRQVEELKLQRTNAQSKINSYNSSSLGMTLTYPPSSMGVYHGLPSDNRAPVDNSFWEPVSLNGLGQPLVDHPQQPTVGNSFWDWGRLALQHPKQLYGVSTSAPTQLYGVSTSAPTQLYGVSISAPTQLYGVSTSAPIVDNSLWAWDSLELEQQTQHYDVSTSAQPTLYGVSTSAQPTQHYGVSTSAPIVDNSLWAWDSLELEQQTQHYDVSTEPTELFDNSLWAWDSLELEQPTELYGVSTSAPTELYGVSTSAPTQLYGVSTSAPTELYGVSTSAPIVDNNLWVWDSLGLQQPTHLYGVSTSAPTILQYGDYSFPMHGTTSVTESILPSHHESASHGQQGLPTDSGELIDVVAPRR